MGSGHFSKSPKEPSFTGNTSLIKIKSKMELLFRSDTKMLTNKQKHPLYGQVSQKAITNIQCHHEIKSKTWSHFTQPYLFIHTKSISIFYIIYTYINLF